MDCAFKTVASFARHRVLILSFLFDFPMTLGVIFSLLLLFLYDSEGFWFTKTATLSSLQFINYISFFPLSFILRSIVHFYFQ